ncbi:hypothetical protein CEXT_595621 [Caerostris extrusa]|uniref:Uncharacterized protein n=1 Tax=Caerostris extrusa TaxID=172846 RepID=A0AAV4Y2D0_CAEEX|nr:hypothetical protein CEXT_595621 [Caerostris extrusa]
MSNLLSHTKFQIDFFVVSSKRLLGFGNLGYCTPGRCGPHLGTDGERRGVLDGESGGAHLAKLLNYCPLGEDPPPGNINKLIPLLPILLPFFFSFFPWLGIFLTTKLQSRRIFTPN